MKKKIIYNNYYIREKYLRKRKSGLYNIALVLYLNMYYRVLYRSKYKTPPITSETNVEKIKLDRVTNHFRVKQNRNTAERFAKLISSSDVISFDIFDTLIFRPFVNPRDLMTVIGEEYDKFYFPENRWNAEMEARKKAFEIYGQREVTLREIYEEYCTKNFCDVEEMIENEFSKELEMCFQNPYMKKVWDILTGMDKKIILISDMYLEKEHIERLLEKNGFTGWTDLFVSCEYRKNKHSGTLYAEVTKKYNPKELKITHIGDNKHADVVMPRKYGFESIFYENVNLNRKEISKLTLSMPKNISSAYQGIINSYFNNGSLNNMHQRYSELYKYGFIVGGIYILGFASWLKKESDLNSIDKLLFLARDGKIYKKVYDKHFKKNETEYVMWSRNISTRLYFEKSPQLYIKRFIKNNKVDISLRNLLEQLNISHVFSDEILEEYNLIGEIIVNNSVYDKIEEMILDYREDIINAYGDEMEETIKYYKNKIGDSKKIGLIDVGWQATGGVILKWLIEEKCKLDVEVVMLNAGYVQNDDRINFASLQDDSLKTYLFSSKSNRNCYAYHRSSFYGMLPFIFELFTQDDSSSFVGFIDDGEDKVKFSTPEVYNYEAYREIRRGVLDFSKEYMKHFSNYEMYTNIPGSSAYAPFMNFTKSHAKVLAILGDLEYEVSTLYGVSPKTIRDMYKEKM